MSEEEVRIGEEERRRDDGNGEGGERGGRGDEGFGVV